MTTWRLWVDGHDWLVRDRVAAPGAYDFDWLTGPDGYGFSMGTSNGTAIDEAAMRRGGGGARDDGPAPIAGEADVMRADELLDGLDGGVRPRPSMPGSGKPRRRCLLRR